MTRERGGTAVRVRDRGAPSRRLLIAGLLLSAGFAAARVWRLAAEGLWVDEAYTAGLARLPLGAMLAALRLDDAPALFYLCQRIVVRLLGDSEGTLRLFPAVCGLGTVGLAWGLCRRHAPPAATFAAVALGFSSLLVFYSRQARSYSLVHLLGTALLWATLSLRRDPSGRGLLAFVAAALGLLYSHNLGALLVGCGVLCLIGSLRRPEQRPRLLALFGLVAVGSIPWAARLLGQVGIHSELNRWMAAWWDQGRPLGLAPLFSWAAFANGAASALRPPIPLPGLDGAAAAPFLGWIAALAGIVGFIRYQRRAERGDVGWSILAFATIPLLGLAAVSITVGPAYVLGRTDTIALPAFLLLVALGWSSWPRALAWSTAGIWTLLALATLLPLWTGDARIAKGSERDLASEIGRQARPGDVLVFSALTRPTLEYYAGRQGWRDRLAWMGSYPGSLDRTPAAPVGTPIDSASAWRQEALELRARWERDGVRRAWILARRDPRFAGEIRAWPNRPSTPPAARDRLDATRVAYPTNILVATLAGLRGVPVEREYRQDWVSGERVLLRIERDRWVPIDSVPAVEAAP